jgi:N-acetylglucosamine malate deacetylase 1
VISPHPDDESVGCGGTLRKHAVEGDAIRVIFVTSGEKGGRRRPPEEAAQVREQEARAAAKILGIAEVEFWRQPDGAVHASPQLVERLRQAIEAWKPQLIYVTHDREMHPDHRASARLVRCTLADLPPGARPVVRMYEVWTPMRMMHRIVDITPYIDVKIAAIRAHQSQCEVMRFDEALPALNRYRGEMHSGWPPARYAEIFTEPRLPHVRAEPRIDN